MRHPEHAEFSTHKFPGIWENGEAIQLSTIEAWTCAITKSFVKNIGYDHSTLLLWRLGLAWGPFGHSTMYSCVVAQKRCVFRTVLGILVFQRHLAQTALINMRQTFGIPGRECSVKMQCVCCWVSRNTTRTISDRSSLNLGISHPTRDLVVA